MVPNATGRMPGERNSPLRDRGTNDTHVFGLTEGTVFRRAPSFTAEAYEPIGPVVDAARLRAALSLVVGRKKAEALIADSDRHDWESLADVVQRASREYSALRLWRWIPIVGGRDDDAPLGPATGLGAEAALGLALHAVVGLDAVQLGDLFDVASDEIAAALDRGRRALEPSLPKPCPGMIQFVARAADRSLDGNERVALATHLERCGACRAVVERSASIDEQLAGVVEGGDAGVAVPRGGDRRVTRAGASRPRGAVSMVAMGGIVVLAVVLVSALLRLTGSSAPPVPLVATADAPTLDGWLISVDLEGSLWARDLASGESRRLYTPESRAEPTGGQYLLSPDRRSVAYLEAPNTRNGQQDIVVIRLASEEPKRIDPDVLNGARSPAGWLDSSTILIIDQRATPSFSGSQPDTQLVAIDVRDLSERVLEAEGILWAMPSPDGTRLLTVGGNVEEEDFSLDLRPLSSTGIGDPLVVFEGFDWSGTPIWASDGGTLFMTRFIDTGDGLPRQGQAPAGTLIAPREVIAVKPDGTIEPLPQTRTDRPISIAGVSPDGSEVVYFVQERSARPGTFTWWRARRDGSPSERLFDVRTDAQGGLGFGGVLWSPDGAEMLVAYDRPIYLQPDEENPMAGRIRATSLVAVSPSGAQRVQETWFAGGTELLAWLPADALPNDEQAGTARSVTVSAPETIDTLNGAYRLVTGSSASADGRYIELVDGTSVPVVYDTARERGRRLHGTADDTSWLPFGAGLIGTSRAVDRARGPSRLSLYSNGYTNDIYLSFDFQGFDPAGIGDDTSRRYARPRVSPNGNWASFYLAGDNSTVELWLAGAEGDAIVVARWTLPRDAILAPTLNAVWLDERTLVFSQPADWADGLPSAARLMRATLSGAGGVAVERLVTLDGRGDDRGIDVTEIVPSPRGSDVAYRVRHYRERAVDDGRYDTVHLASASDISQEIELARGGLSDGLSWSPDGSRLAMAARGRVVLVAIDDLATQTISSDDTRASNPIWVGRDEIWFAESSDGVERIVRVYVSYEGDD
jgi:Tol biopolymer transport system component